MNESKLPNKARNFLVYPENMAAPEPRMVNLRQGGAQILGHYYRMMELAGERAAKLLERMDAIVDEDPFPLSPGCRLLQELYGPASEYGANPFLQQQLRNVLVFMSAVERIGAERYAPPPPPPASPEAPHQSARRGKS